MLTFAQLESSRFGLCTYRATLDEVNTEVLFRQMVVSRADLAIIRVHPNAAAKIRALDAYAVVPLQADTLVTYGCELQETESTLVTQRGFEIDVARDDDREAIGELINTVFSAYSNHYTANPLLARKDVMAGYREWALSHLEGGDRIAWVARARGRVAAIACSTFDAASGECQGVLHGVHPDFARSGIYTALIRHTQNYFQHQGYRRLTIQTQAANMPVQRVWVREGFALSDVHATFHVNALLDTAHGAVKQIELCFPTGNFMETQRTFLDAVFSQGSESMRASRIATGTTTRVFRPIVADSAYCLFVKLYDFERNCGSSILMGTLYDTDKQLCAIARATISKP